jgi:hypothetical protein
MTIGSKPPNDGPDELEITFGVEAVEIGIDATGKPTMATVITGQLDRQAPQQKRQEPKATPDGQRAWAAFQQLLANGKATTAPTPDAPDAVTEADLRATTIDMWTARNPEPVTERKAWVDKRRAAWARAKAGVVESGLLIEAGGFFWSPVTVTKRDYWRDET